MSRAHLALAALLLAASPPEPAVSYFTNVRDIHISQPGLQNYFVVDEEIWSHARPDLADLRLYDGASQVPYALREQRGGTASQEAPARILNLGNAGGHVEFDLDMGQIEEYDHIRLNLDAKNFVATAAVAGSNQPGAKQASQLPPSTLYDFTREQLGSNAILKLPASSFRYLHVKLSAGILPQQVKGATVYNLQETKAAWTSVGSCGAPSQAQRATIIACSSPRRVPVDRIRFQVDPKRVNFRRTVLLFNASGRQYGAGDITRVRLNRGGTTVISEDMDVAVAGQSSGQLTITVENGDNPPLAIAGVQLLSVERRVYFDPQGKPQLKLYYGDYKLESPVYDYTRFFRADPAAATAEPGSGAHNESYSGRPDDRPWSERHQVMLWLAMLLAVAVLAVLAIRGLKAGAAA